MGQLEKYGLYVLCLVIFLILGVTIWGGGDAQTGKMPATSIRTNTTGPAKGTTGNEVAQNDRMKSLADALLETGGEPRRASAAGGGKDAGGNGGNQPANGSEPKVDAKHDPKGDPKGEAQPGARLPVRTTYKVQEGDTFDSIARSKLGKASLCNELMKQNPGIEPKKLRPGMELVLPDVTALAAATKADAKEAKPTPAKLLTPPADGSRTYVVKKGDTFERIAIAELGSKRRTSELLELNAGLDPTRLKLGMSLKLPKK